MRARISTSQFDLSIFLTGVARTPDLQIDPSRDHWQNHIDQKERNPQPSRVGARSVGKGTVTIRALTSNPTAVSRVNSCTAVILVDIPFSIATIAIAPDGSGNVLAMCRLIQALQSKHYQACSAGVLLNIQPGKMMGIFCRLSIVFSASRTNDQRKR
ncbi:hypothetical protein BD779DRAFT_1516741 [Infundibulicybe gibba]|nr:hypothetical protein BD779DRAFT_1516741 [Infundibulicybe gibba]